MRTLIDDFIQHGRDYDQLETNTMAIDPPRDGWKTFARLLSTRFGGQFWPGKASVTWCMGSRHIEYVVDRDSLRQVIPARKLCAGIGIEKPGWAIGKLARQIIRWIDSPQSGSGNCEQLIEGRHGYYSCEPGQYDEINMFDVTGCYWQIFSLMPSMRVAFHEHARKIQFMRMEESERSRFEQVKRVFSGNKAIRNAILGAMTGGNGAAPYYCHGEKRYLHLPPGPNRAAGYVIIRTVWELTQAAAAISESVLTMVDSVCTQAFEPPSIWQDVGLTVKRAAWGPADIVRPGVYLVGDKASAGYWMGCRDYTRIPQAPAPEYQIGVWL